MVNIETNSTKTSTRTIFVGRKLEIDGIRIVSRLVQELRLLMLLFWRSSPIRLTFSSSVVITLMIETSSTLFEIIFLNLLKIAWMIKYWDIITYCWPHEWVVNPLFIYLFCQRKEKNIFFNSDSECEEVMSMIIHSPINLSNHLKSK